MTARGLAVLAALAACENTAAVSAGGGTQFASRAAALGEFPDNPMLGFVPADTPYAFATFKPFPLDVVRKTTALIGPVWRRMFATFTAQAPDSADQRRVVEDILEAFETLDVKRFEEYGFSAKARFAVYGIGAYPVLRVELSNGDRVFDLIRRTAERWNKPLPPPTERAGRRYWSVDLPDPGLSDPGLFLAIAPKEAVLAVAPRSVIDGNLPALLGERRPASGMTTAQFRALAERDGFTGQGVGFVDLVRVGALIANVAGAAPDCRAAVTAITNHAPRLAVGYDELTVHRLAFGMVLELAPEVLADARGLAGSLAGLDRLLGHKPEIAVAIAGNLEHGRAVLGRAAGALQELGRRCEMSSLVDGVTELAAVAARPLPPIVAGLHGGFLVVNNLKMGAHGPETIDGFGSVQLDHTGELLKFARGAMPDFEVQADGKARPLPPASPFSGHVAVDEHAIGLGLGANSATTAAEALQGRAGPAPLALVMFDYSRMGDLLLASTRDLEADYMREFIKAFGLATFQLLVDARGVVMWGAFEMR